MPTVDIDGIATHYEISGSGPPILMMAPGGFDSAIEKWSTTWPWQHFLPLQVFARDYSCIAYDRREAGHSGGHTDFHATSCARYLEECIPDSEYWDVHLESQPPGRLRDRILDFLSAHAGAGVHA
jgi:pimeloyl-ACP methyl ester carboxylesterase